MAENFTWGSQIKSALLMVAIGSWTFNSFIVRIDGGIAFIVVAILFQLLFTIPSVYLQVLFGQYSGAGVLRIWRAFPIVRGVAIVWLLSTFLCQCIDIVDYSRVFIYIVPVLSSSEYPWLTCNNEWNTKTCESPLNSSKSQITTTTIDPLSDEVSYPTEPSGEYWLSTISFDAVNIVAVALMWILIALPLIKGPQSLLRSVFVFLPLILGLNFMLFFRAVTLPSNWDGVRFIFSPMDNHFNYYRNLMHLSQMVLGSWFAASNGVCFLIGKYMVKDQSSLPPILIGFAIIVILNIINSVKEAAFLGYFTFLLGRSGFEFFNYWHVLTSVPTILSTLPAPGFFLMVHFLFLIFSSLPVFSFCLEVFASSIADFLPGNLANRTKFPQSCLLPAILGFLGFLISLVALYLKTVDFKVWSFYTAQELVFFVVLSLFVTVLAPLSISKVVNSGREDLFAFVQKQGIPSQASFRRIWTIFSLIATGVSIIILNFLVVPEWRDGLFASYPGDKGEKVVSFVWLGIRVFIVVVVAVVQCILYLVRGERSPCCVSVGKLLDEKEEKLESSALYHGPMVT